MEKDKPSINQNCMPNIRAIPELGVMRLLRPIGRFVTQQYLYRQEYQLDDYEPEDSLLAPMTPITNEQLSLWEDDGKLSD